MKPESQNLRLALLHMAVRHKDPDCNREVLLQQIQQAAQKGASIAVAPEMCVSGYSFDMREDILPYTETRNSPFAASLAESARKNGLYVCVGLAEKDEPSQILYNSAFVFGPDGRLLLTYRKINAECRWACAGDPKQNNTFDTPWGRVGVLICSDTYHGLMPRATAIRGADLLLAPANWPVTGLNPLEIWRGRALENGIFVAGCNRTGTDLTMDCREAPSGVWNPKGQTLFEGQKEDSGIFYVDLPLMDRGRLDGRTRRQRMATRRPAYCYDIYLRINAIRDFTGFLNLPKPGKMRVQCSPLSERDDPASAVKNGENPSSSGLWLFPQAPYSDSQLDAVKKAAQYKNQRVLLALPNDGNRRYLLFQGDGGPVQWDLPDWPFDMGENFPCFDAGPARFFTVPVSALTHPELAVSFAKKGCDMILAVEKEISEEQRLMAAIRTIENAGIAVCAGNGAGVWLPPKGHNRWEEIWVETGETCRLEVDTADLRTKRFQDFVDFELLLGMPPDGLRG